MLAEALKDRTVIISFGGYADQWTCVTYVCAGVNSVWEQEKQEARKVPENAAESPASSARFVRRRLTCNRHRFEKSIKPSCF
jgi:hypothetical protein